MAKAKKTEEEKIDPNLTPKEKLAALIKKLKGEGSLKNARICLGSDPEVAPELIPFNVPELDTLCRGVLRGGYTILYGAEKAGKSTVMFRMIASMQQAGLHPALFDLEERFDPTWAAIQGVDLENLTLVQNASDLEEALTIIEAGVKNDIFTGIAIDSITAKAARGELQDKSGKERSIDDDTMAIVARLLSKWFRRATASIKAKRVPVVLLAQVRTANLQAGAFLDITGGLALRHYASTVIRMGRADKISMTKGGTKMDLGYWLKAELKKTSLCVNEGKDVRLPFYFGVGIDDVAAAVRAGINLGLIKNLPRGLEFNEKKYISEPAFVERLRESSELRDTLFAAVSAATGDSVDTIDDSTDQLAQESAPAGNLEPTGSPIESGTCAICGKTGLSDRGLVVHKTRVHATKE